MDYGPLVAAPYLGTIVRVFARRPASLAQLLAWAAATWPDRPAVEAPAATLTYAELDRSVSVAAAGLAAAGVRPGDRLAAALDHDLALFALPFACSRLGAAALLLNPTLGVSRWTGQLADSRWRLLLADAAHHERLRAAAGGAPVADAARVLPLEGAPPATASAVLAPAEDRPVAFIATSGTTGTPKTTTVTSRGLIHAALGYVRLLDLRAGERTLVVLPLYYIGALSAQSTTMPLVGGCVVIPDDTRPAGALRRLAERRITHLDAVPSWLALLAREREPWSLPRWRTLIYGGAPMPPKTSAQLAARHPGVRQFDVWGLSETHGPATALRYDPAAPPPPGTVGRPLAGVDVEAVGAAGTPVPAGALGELRVRGANVTPGYLNDPDTTAAAIRGGWLATGDVGAVDGDGTVRILDRKKDVILRGGANVFSVEVEQVLCSAPGVAEAAVYGVADGIAGEAVVAAVVPAGDAALDAGALRRLVGDRIGVHAVPRRIVRVDALPRNPNGKIDKKRLRDQHG